METTTGISAPPMGTISRIPMVKLSSTIAQKTQACCVTQKITINTTSKIPSKAFSICCPLKTSGFEEITPCSFPNAMMEPVKVTAPIAVPSAISISEPTAICPATPIL